MPRRSFFKRPAREDAKKEPLMGASDHGPDHVSGGGKRPRLLSALAPDVKREGDVDANAAMAGAGPLMAAALSTEGSSDALLLSNPLRICPPRTDEELIVSSGTSTDELVLKTTPMISRTTYFRSTDALYAPANVPVDALVGNKEGSDQAVNIAGGGAALSSSDAAGNEADSIMKKYFELPSTKLSSDGDFLMRVYGEIPSDKQSAEADSIMKEYNEIPSTTPSPWACCLRRSRVVPFLLAAISLSIFAGLIYGASLEYGYDFESFTSLFANIDWDKEINVAFIGNAYLLVNDMPRVMQALSDNHIHQNSVLHPGGSLGSLLATGNGMYKIWQTGEAEIGGGYRYYENYGGDRIMYDFGLCTVAQILQGYDEYIEYGNPYGMYYNDGLNPCIKDKNYASYVGDQLAVDPPNWDFVVLADQTKRIAVEAARQDTIDALLSDYVPFLEGTGATPVIVGTHAFLSTKTNMTGLGDDIPAFTVLIQKGVKAYAKALSDVLPRSQKATIAPVHIAYLTVWEEDYEFWQTLFVGDTMHSSARGTYLATCVLYATMLGHLPDKDISMPEDMSSLFSSSRKLIGQATSFPTFDEAVYLRNVCKRVALKGYVPSSYETR
jgi:hypothetical protein